MNVLMRESAHRAAAWPHLPFAVLKPEDVPGFDGVGTEHPCTKDDPLGLGLTSSAGDLLNQARQIMAERAKTYDQPGGERSMGKTVAAFNAITGRNLTEAEGWLLQAVLKMVRGQSKPEPHSDSVSDLVSYSSLYGEARLAGR